MSYLKLLDKAGEGAEKGGPVKLDNFLSDIFALPCRWYIWRIQNTSAGNWHQSDARKDWSAIVGSSISRKRARTGGTTQCKKMIDRTLLMSVAKQYQLLQSSRSTV